MGTVWATSWIHTRLLSSVGAAVSHTGGCKSWACSDNTICPFLARFLLPFSVNCWNTSLYNGFGIQSWSFDTTSDLTCSSGNREHMSTILNGPALAEVFFFFFFLWVVKFEKTQVCSFLFTMPLFVLWRPRVSEGIASQRMKSECRCCLVELCVWVSSRSHGGW